MNLQDDLSLYMDRGEAALGRGEYEQAVDHFGLAVTVAHEIVDGEAVLCEAMQMLGIALRLEGDLDNAEMVFNEALQRAPAGSSLVGRIKRDYGMIWLDRGHFATAIGLFDESQHDLWEAGEALEAYVSEGFKGRVYIGSGERRKAIETLLITHRKLRSESNRAYELNNLMWLAWVSPRYRWVYVGRAFALIGATRHVRRLRQYVALLLGLGRFHNFAR